MPVVDPAAFLGTGVDRFELDQVLEVRPNRWAFVARAQAGIRYVLQLLSPRRARQSAALEDVRSLVAVDHPRLTRYHAYGSISDGALEGNLWVARLYEGQSLRHLIGEKKEMAPEMLLGVVSDTIEALKHLHVAGVIHGDITPRNLICVRQRWFVADFGLEELTRSQSDLSPHVLRYRAPETLDGEYLPASDVYAMAATVLDAFLGRASVTAGFGSSLIKLLEERSLVPSRVPAPWKDVLTACLSADPALRPTLAEVELALGISKEPRRDLMLRLVSEQSFMQRLRRLLVGSGFPTEGIEDAVSDVITRILTKSSGNPHYFERFEKSDDLLRYVYVAARNQMFDEMRQNRRYVLQSDLPREDLRAFTNDPIDEFSRSYDAILDIESRIGHLNAGVLRMRAYGHDLETIAGWLSRGGDTWTAQEVFLLLYRLRRAFPELASLLPWESLESSRTYLTAWLETAAPALNEVDRQLVAGRLAGEPISEAANRLELSAATARSRLFRLVRAEPWLRLILSPNAALRREWIDIGGADRLIPPPIKNLEPGWLVRIRDKAAELLAGANGEASSMQGAPDELLRHLPSTADEVVESMLSDIELAVQASEAVLAQPMLDTYMAAEALGLEVDTAGEQVEALRSQSMLIVLSTRRGPLVPAFQVGPEGLYPVVVEVNSILGSVSDPWGVASWWLSPHGRLGGKAPKDLLDSKDNYPVILQLAGSEDAPVG